MKYMKESEGLKELNKTIKDVKKQIGKLEKSKKISGYFSLKCKFKRFLYRFKKKDG